MSIPSTEMQFIPWFVVVYPVQYFNLFPGCVAIYPVQYFNLSLVFLYSTQYCTVLQFIPCFVVVCEVQYTAIFSLILYMQYSTVCPLPLHRTRSASCTTPPPPASSRWWRSSSQASGSHSPATRTAPPHYTRYCNSTTIRILPRSIQQIRRLNFKNLCKFKKECHKILSNFFAKLSWPLTDMIKHFRICLRFRSDVRATIWIFNFFLHGVVDTHIFKYIFFVIWLSL